MTIGGVTVAAQSDTTARRGLPFRVIRVGFVVAVLYPINAQHRTFSGPAITSQLGQERPSDRHEPAAPAVRAAQALPSTKSGLFQPFEHKILRLLRAELSGEHPGVEEWP